MQTTSSTYALESLKLQHQNHIRQQEIILAKQQRMELRKSKVPDHSNSRLPSSTTETVVELNVTGSESRTETVSSQRNNVIGTPDNQFAQDFNDLYKTMSETDSLLQFLNQRSHARRDKDIKHDAFVRKNRKLPKSYETVIEELQIHNADLRKNILMLLEEVDGCRREKERLLEKVEHQERCRALDPEAMFAMDQSRVQLPAIELPPLEMPSFDFDSLTDDSNEYDNKDT